MLQPQVDDLWAMMDHARRRSDPSSYDDFVCDDDDDDDDDEAAESAASADSSAVVFKIGNGQFHVCYGQNCIHAEQSTEDEKSIVCRISGRVISSSFESAHDSSWTGRSCTSADPDMASGAVPSKAWRFKRDAFADSARAYNRAKQLTRDDVDFDEYNVALFATKETSVEDSKIAKRGAPCVSEINEEAVSEHKRAKAMKRITSLSRREVQSRLNCDAATVVKKLFSVLPQSKPGAENDSKDPRLENYKFVFSIGLKRYAKRCADENEQLSLSTIHDIAICASNYVRERRKDAKIIQDQSKTRMLVVNTRTTDLCGRLIVSIWNAVCNTSHFVENQPGDSFRPFAAGIMYAMKRGIRMKSGLVVVPCIDVLSIHLPTLRSSSGNAEARQLQASSHRGLCAVHRAIASIDSMPIDDQVPVLEKLQVASLISTSLEKFVYQYMAQDKYP